MNRPKNYARQYEDAFQRELRKETVRHFRRLPGEKICREYSTGICGALAWT